MNLPIIIVPKSVSEYLNAKNPIVFKEEDLCFLFGVSLDEKVDGKEVLIITHAFQLPGMECFYSKIEFTEESEEKLPLIENGLEKSAKKLGLKGCIVGMWHTHPDNLLSLLFGGSATASDGDMNSCRNSSEYLDLGFWLLPISCRFLRWKYTHWQIYIESVDNIFPIPSYNILELENAAVYRLNERLANFIMVNPDDFLTGVSEIEPENRCIPIDDNRWAFSDNKATPLRMWVEYCINNQNLYKKIDWIKVAAVASLIISIINLLHKP